MIVLGIESAIRGGSLSLYRGGEIMGQWTGRSGVSRAEELLPNIARLLNQSSFRPMDLDLIAVSTGPGSFTGIRIGIATVLGLRASLGVKCIGITALEAMAASAQGSRVVCAVPVGGRNIAVQTFSHDESESGPALIREDELVPTLLGFDVAVLHGLLHQSIGVDAVGSTPIADAGHNIAGLVAAASGSDFVDSRLRPLFLSRQMNEAG